MRRRKTMVGCLYRYVEHPILYSGGKRETEIKRRIGERERVAMQGEGKRIDGMAWQRTNSPKLPKFPNYFITGRGC